GSRNGGFTSGEPWLCMGDDVDERNILRQQQDTRSLLWLYRSLIRLRKGEPALRSGDYLPLRARNDLLLYKRVVGQDVLLIALNFSNEPRRLEFEERTRLLISTHLDRTPTNITPPMMLRGSEGVI